MTVDDPDKRALAAGFVTATLDKSEVEKAEALLMADADFAELVSGFRAQFEAEGTDALPERVWESIERGLTRRQN